MCTCCLCSVGDCINDDDECGLSGLPACDITQESIDLLYDLWVFKHEVVGGGWKQLQGDKEGASMVREGSWPIARFGRAVWTSSRRCEKFQRVQTKAARLRAQRTVLTCTTGTAARLARVKTVPGAR